MEERAKERVTAWVTEVTVHVYQHSSTHQEDNVPLCPLALVQNT